MDIIEIESTSLLTTYFHSKIVNSKSPLYFSTDFPVTL